MRKADVGESASRALRRMVGMLILPDGQIGRGPVQPRLQKYFRFLLTQITSLICHPAPTRGAYRDRHGRRMRDAVDARGALTNAQASGRQRRVVLMPRRWHQVGGSHSAGDGGKQARSPGSNCVLRRPVIGRPQGWRWRATAFGGDGLDPVRSPVFWLCMRSVLDRARSMLDQLTA